MHAEDDFDPLAIPSPPLAPVIPISPKKPALKTRPRQPDYPLPTEPPEHDPAPRLLSPAYIQPPSVRTLPHSPEAEEYLLSCCLLDGADVLPKCLDAQIAADSFYDSRHGIVFNCLLDLHRRGLPTEPANVAEELKRTRQLDQVGGYAFLVQVSSRVPTSAQAPYFIKTVREYALRRELIRVSTGVVEDAYSTTDALDVAEKCEKRLAETLRRAQHATDCQPMQHATLGYPTSNDPNILLGKDDYLGRGGGLLFIAHGGAGKSSFIYDAACTWALGRPFLGIRCNGPLRTLIIQAEDSERYIGKLRASFDFANKLTAEDRTRRDENVIIYHARGITGSAFFALLRRLVEKHAPDLVVLNPIYLYAEGDISSPDAAQPFLLGLDAINREQRFGYILVHHTGKPAKKDGKNQRAELKDWETIYEGFGSSFFANWPRCTMLLEPRGKEHGKYLLRLGKNGLNAGVTKEVPQGVGMRLEPTTKIAIRHSSEVMPIADLQRPVIHWEFDTETVEEEPAKRTKADKSRAGLPEILALYPAGVENALMINAVAKRAHDTYSMGANEFHEMRKELSATGAISLSPSGMFYRANTA